MSDMHKPAGDSDWPWHELTDTQGDLHRARMPDWVAEGFKQPAFERHKPEAHAAPGAVAAGAEVGEEVTSPAHAQVAGQVHFGVPQQITSAVAEPTQPVSAAPVPAAAAGTGLTAAVQPGVMVAGVTPTGSGTTQDLGMPVATAMAAAAAAPSHAAATQSYVGTPVNAPVPGATAVRAGVTPEQSSAAAAQARAVSAMEPACVAAAAGTSPATGAPPGSQSAAALTAATQNLQGFNVPVRQNYLLDMLPVASAATTADHNNIAGISTSSSEDDAGSMQHSTVHARSSQAAASRAAVSTLHDGFDAWIDCLYPKGAETRRIRATLDAVRAVLHSRAKGQQWSVSALYPVGSFSRKTSLRYREYRLYQVQ